MILALGVLSLIFAVVAGGSAVIVHRRSVGMRGAQWSARGSLLLSLAIIVGTAPNVFLSTTWLRIAGSLLSLVLTGASLVAVRRQWRAGAARSQALDR